MSHKYELYTQRSLSLLNWRVIFDIWSWDYKTGQNNDNTIRLLVDKL